MKVYCCKCRFYRDESDDFGGWDWCTAPGNLKDTYRKPDIRTKKSPAKINKKNNCKMFKRKRTFIEWLNDLIV